MAIFEEPYMGLYKDAPTEIIMYWNMDLNSIDSASEVLTVIHWFQLEKLSQMHLPGKFWQSYRKISALFPPAIYQ